MRRYRQSEALRRLHRETVIRKEDLILPVFIVPGTDRREHVDSMPGVQRLSVDLLPRWAASRASLAVLVFGVPDPDEKDARASGATAPDGLVPRAVATLKEERPELVVITDVCLCAYMNHGHCGKLTAEGRVDNDATLSLLAAMAEAHAAAGADMVAPSAVMDGQVDAIRRQLDQQNLQNTMIMSYAAKFASSFYGPFRDAAHSPPGFGDRKSYQIPPPNRREAIMDALLDEKEGADWLMVKPALPYLDVLAELVQSTRLPVSAYQVSGEYAMIKCAARAGTLDERAAAMESVLSIKRAGADAVITYFAEDICKWINES